MSVLLQSLVLKSFYHTLLLMYWLFMHKKMPNFGHLFIFTNEAIYYLSILTIFSQSTLCKQIVPFHSTLNPFSFFQT